MIKSGVYQIVNLINGKVYVGSSINLARRKNEHARHLRDGKHHSSYLQRAYNKYGRNCFKFEVLEYADTDRLKEVEQHYINKYRACDRRRGYNISESAAGPLVNGINGKLSERQVEDIKRTVLTGTTQIELSRKYDVSVSTISKIVRGINWKWVIPELNKDLYTINEEAKKERNEAIKELYEKGEPAAKIARTLKCDKRTIKKVVKTSRLIEARARRKQIEKDYLDGMTREEIMSKYCVARDVVNAAVRNAYQEQLANKYSDWVELRRSGVSVGDIADKYNVHRTTVTENTKEHWQQNGREVKVVRIGNEGKPDRIYKSVKEAAAKNGCHHSNIIKCCKGRDKTSGGYKWMYYTDYIESK